MPRQIALSPNAARITRFALALLADSLNDPEIEAELCRHLGQKPGSENLGQQCRLLADEITNAFRPVYLIDVPWTAQPDDDTEDRGDPRFRQP